MFVVAFVVGVEGDDTNEEEEALEVVEDNCPTLPLLPPPPLLVWIMRKAINSALPRIAPAKHHSSSCSVGVATATATATDGAMAAAAATCNFNDVCQPPLARRMLATQRPEGVIEVCGVAYVLLRWVGEESEPCCTVVANEAAAAVVDAVEEEEDLLLLLLLLLLWTLEDEDSFVSPMSIFTSVVVGISAVTAVLLPSPTSTVVGYQ